jgi:hypothetical protein
VILLDHSPHVAVAAVEPHIVNVKMGLNYFALPRSARFSALEPSHARAIQVIGRALARWLKAGSLRLHEPAQPAQRDAGQAGR